MTKEQANRIAQTVQEMGGEWVAPLAVSHFLSIGEQVAEKITAERIAQEVKKQEQKEKEAEAAGMVCLMSAELVGDILAAVSTLAHADTFTKYAIIKKYL